MSSILFECPKCGRTIDLFDEGGIIRVRPGDQITVTCACMEWSIDFLVRDPRSLGRRLDAVNVRIHATRLSGFIHRNVRRQWRKWRHV